jgi:hypothetical protein
MKLCQSCCARDAKVSIVTKLGGFTKFDLCGPCSHKKENELSMKGVQYAKREIRTISKSWL